MILSYGRQQAGWFDIQPAIGLQWGGLNDKGQAQA